MSRESNTDYYYDGPNTYGIWMHAYGRAVKSKRGQAFLKEMKTALEVIPNHRLISSSWCEESGVCALGAVAVKREVDATGQAWEETKATLIPVFGQGETDDLRRSSEFAVDEFGVQRTIAWEVAQENDGGVGNETSADRWQRMYDFVNSMIIQDGGDGES